MSWVQDNSARVWRCEYEEGRVTIAIGLLLGNVMCVLHVLPCDLADLTLFDEKGNKTSTPDKERQIEALQLLFLILPAPNRSLLKLLLDLLYQTAKKQDKNKMSAHNLALMFAPHILWPRNVSNATVSVGRMLQSRRQNLGRLIGEEPRWEDLSTDTVM